MNVDEVKKLFCEYFKSKQHTIIPSASLVPSVGHDVLFTTAGMHPLILYLAGEPSPYGKRIANVQKVVRTGAIDYVGDNSFCTFFELLGNWSLGEYHKSEAIAYAWDFLTSRSYIGIDKDKLHITCFSRNELYDEYRESYNEWVFQGVDESHIWEHSTNWKGPYSQYQLCGPNTKIFYDTGTAYCCNKCGPLCSCGKFVEIWDIVFLDFYMEDGKLKVLTHKNVDTGMGVERLAAITEGVNSVYETDVFLRIIEFIKSMCDTNYDADNAKDLRVIADHIRCATFILGDNERVVPSSNGRGYVLRKIVRRAMNASYRISLQLQSLIQIAQHIISIYSDEYPELYNNKDYIINTLTAEINMYEIMLNKGTNKLKKILEKNIGCGQITRKELSKFHETFGLPYEMIDSLVSQSKLTVQD